MQALFNSADGLANCSPENMQFWLWRFISDEALAVVSSNILLMLIPEFSFVVYPSLITLQECWSLTTHTCPFFYLISSGNYIIHLYSCSQ